MVIDAHCHIYPDKIADKAAHATARFYMLPATYDGELSTLLEAGAKAGIDRFVVQSVATTPHQVSSINHFIAESVAAYPDKLYGLGTLHPESADQEADVRELMALGLKGVKLHHDIQRFKIDDYRCLKIYELCESYGLPILLHTGDNRRVIGAHFGGWSMWEEASELLKNRENFFVDCSSAFYALDNETVRRIIANYGTDRVLFGTDYPMWNVEEEKKRFDTLGYGETDREKMLCFNALRAFNLEA